MKTLITVTITSIIIFTFQYFLFLFPISRLLILSIIEPVDDDNNKYIAKEEILLKSKENIIKIPKGTILIEPCRHDLIYTDIGDPRVWKIIIDDTNLIGSKKVEKYNNTDEKLKALWFSIISEK